MSERDITEENIIEATDQDGNPVHFEHLLTFEYGETFYVAMLPVELPDDMEEGEVLLMRLEEDGDNDVFLPIDTEEELEGAWNAFLEMYYEDDEDEE